MTSAQEARADGWQRDTAQRNATVAGLARENRQLREQLAEKGHAMTEPVPDTDAMPEPASMAERRDHITEVRQAVEAERERFADLLEAAWVVIANAHEGNWDAERPDWREAAERWRDRYHEWLHEYVRHHPESIPQETAP